MLKYTEELSVISGSKLYGTDRVGSDDDIRSIMIPPFAYLINAKGLQDPIELEGDYKIFSLKKYFELALKCDTQMIEVFFTPNDKILKCTYIGARILSLKDLFISNTIFARVLGYGSSEFRKSIGVKLEIDERTKTEDDVINDIRNVFSPDRDDMDHVISILTQNKPRKLVHSMRDFGAKRKAEFEKYGFGVSSGAHSLRLAQELIEIATTGHITFPRPNASFLKDIRNGKYSKEEFIEIYQDVVKQAEETKKHSILPDKPQTETVWKEYVDIAKQFLKLRY